MVLKGLKTRKVCLALELPLDPYHPNLWDPLTPGPGTRRLVKVSSTGTESSDDFEERDPGKAGSKASGTGRGQGWTRPPSPYFPTDLGDGLENGSGSPFRKWTLSNAAQTHRLRRLRGPAKCRECEAFMVSGTECEEVWPGPMTPCSLLTPLTSLSPRHLHDLIFL